jgi:hypothetical protein
MTELDMTPIRIEDLTDDDYERALILDEPERQYVEGPDDPHHIEMARIQAELAGLQRRMPQKRKRVPYLFMRGIARKDIAQKLDITYMTVCKAIDSSDGKRMMSLIQRATQLELGPSIQSRKSLLWRIALRNHETNPRVTLSAIDILNKQDGVYAKHTEEQDRAPRVLIQQFMEGQTKLIPIENANQGGTVIEGEFVPLTVHTKG